MKTIKYNNKDYNIPERWDDVTVGMLIKSAELSEILEDAPIIVIIHAYTGIPINELKRDKASEVGKILEIMDFLQKPYEPKPSTSIHYKGLNYSCKENLSEQNFEDFVSIQTALYNNRENEVMALPKMLAIYCKRDGETLDDFNLNERANEFLNLPMTRAKDVECFFLHSLNLYNVVSQLSSTQNQRRDIVLEKLQDLNNIVRQYRVRNGISFFMKLQIGYYLIQLWWVKKVLERYFSLEPSKPLKKSWIQTFKRFLSKTLKRNDNK